MLVTELLQWPLFHSGQFTVRQLGFDLSSGLCSIIFMQQKATVMYPENYGACQTQ